MRLLPIALGLPLLAACPPPPSVEDARCELLFEAPVVTFPAAPVGSTSTLRFKVSAARADCTVSAMNLANEGAAVFSAAPLDAGGASLTDDGAVIVPKNSSVELAVEYSPPDSGYHTATVTLTVPNGLERNPTVQVRASADLPHFIVRPQVVDFGDIAKDTTQSAYVYVDNLSTLDLTFDQAAFSSSDTVATSGELTVATPFPLTVPGGTLGQPIEVRYTPAIDRTLSAELALSTAQDIVRVLLISHNCEHGVAAAYDQDGDGHVSCGDDCNDADGLVYPGASELPDGKDNDCNGLTDEGTPGYDDDGDGFCEPGRATCLDRSARPGDCADDDPTINPDAAEACPSDAPECSDGIDNNCDGVVDGGATDQDHDGYTDVGGDCDLIDPEVHPGAVERADGKDNDCDGTTDEGTSAYDDDGDGYTEQGGDCDDRATPASLSNTYPGAATHPGATELPDRRDNNCDGRADEGTFLYDDDGDGFAEGDPADLTVPDALRDCDDTNPARSPGNREVVGDAAGLDEDCDPTTGP